MSGKPPDGGKAPPGGESSLTLQRGLALLQAVADSESDSVGISELATAIGASRAAVYRLLVPLSERGLIWREGTRVRLGLGLLALASRVFPQLRSVALPILRELAETAGVTAHLSVAEGDEVQAVAVVEPSWTNFHVGYREGSRHSIGRGAAGKALLLDQDGPEWVESVGELEPGAHGVAAPLRGLPGLRASVGVVSLTELHADTVGPHIVRTAVALAAALRS